MVRKILSLLLLASLLLTLPVSMSAQQYDLVIYTARNERLNKIVIDGFREETGLNIEVITGNSGEVLQRVKAEVDSGKVTVDVHWAADETMLSANRDLFEVYVSTENDAMMPMFQNDGNNPFNAAFAEPNVMIVNTKMLEELGVTVESYADLLKPELKGKIITADPANSSSAFQCLIGMLYGMGNGDPMSKEAWDFMDQYLVNLDGKIANGSSQVFNGVAAGEYAVGLSYEDPGQGSIRHRGHHLPRPVRADYQRRPQHGKCPEVCGLCLVRKSPARCGSRVEPASPQGGHPHQ